MVNCEIALFMAMQRGIMFGHQDTDQNDDQATQNEPAADAMLTQDAGAPPVDSSAIAAPAGGTPGAPAMNDDAASDYIMTEPHQTAMPDDASVQQEVTIPAGTPADDLLTLKQQALQQLSPLVGHLDQTPEEKFRTTMMLIQASDDQSLLKDAYAAAQQIADEKTKAQALLDVVNEINYFTQQHEAAA